MKLVLSSSPHIRHKDSTQSIMRDVLIALLPCVVASLAIFGWRSLMLIIISALTAVACEAIANRVMKRPSSISDLSAVVTGVLYALILPAGAPVFLAVLGPAFAIIIVKQLFGGIGANILNPALAARAFMTLSFPEQINTLPDAISSSTPLMDYKTINVVGVSYADLFWGNSTGMMGETAKVAILIGLVYLLVRRVISWQIPVFVMGSAALLSFILGRDPLFDLLAGGLLFGAVYMATDYVTSPTLPVPRAIYATGVGAITIVIREFGSYTEGVMFAILLMNIATPLIDRFYKPKAFGQQKGGAA